MGLPTGLRFSNPTEFYPRFRFYLRRLESIVPRFKSVLDFAKLSSCISDGKGRLDRISAATEHLGKNFEVTVIGGNTKELEGLESEVRVIYHGMFKTKREWTSWSNILIDLEKCTRFDPYFLVYVMENPTVEMIKGLQPQFSTLGEEQLTHILIYDTVSKKNYLYTECTNEKGPSLQTGEHSNSIGQHIQYLLEDRAVEVLEMIVSYAGNFAPRPGVEPDQSLLDECSTKVLESLSSQQVLEDLSPESKLQLGSTSIDSDPYPSTSTDQTGSQTIMGAPTKDQKFHDNLQDFMFKKTKCIICDHLAKKYGIPSSLVNEFMNKGFHDYEKEYSMACSQIQMPTWDEVKTRKCQVGFLNYVFVMKQSRTILNTESYIKEKMFALREVLKFVIEISSLLRNSVVPLSVSPLTCPTLHKKLQQELLNIPEVNGCGTIYGRLTLHVTKDLSFTSNQQVKKLLRFYNYYHQFDVKLVQESIKQAGPAPAKVECGNEVQAKLTATGLQKMKEENARLGLQGNTRHEKSGSLGCFVKLRKQSGSLASAQEFAESDLYAITCAHCVTDCEPVVKVRVGRKMDTLGVTENFIDDGERVDIAVIKVNSDQVNQCDISICTFNRDWVLYEGQAGDVELVGKTVFKRGYVSGESTGIICCNDYRTKRMEDWNNSSRSNFDNIFNILIDVEPGSEPEAAFSQGGDSGSVVYYELTNDTGLTTTVVAVSMVQGSMTHNNKYLCTYSCHLKHSLDEVCSQFGYTLEVPGPTELLYCKQGRGN